MKTSLELRELARAGTSKALVLFALLPWTWNSRVEGTGSELLALEVPPCRVWGDGREKKRWEQLSIDNGRFKKGPENRAEETLGAVVGSAHPQVL